jgi:hypothetical protein
MAPVAWSHHFGSSLPRVQDKVNPTLEYTAPYVGFGDQEIILITFPGQDDDVGLWINLDVKVWVAIVLPHPHSSFLHGDVSILERMKDLHLSCKSELDQRGLI